MLPFIISRTFLLPYIISRTCICNISIIMMSDQFLSTSFFPLFFPINCFSLSLSPFVFVLTGWKRRSEPCIGIAGLVENYPFSSSYGNLNATVRDIPSSFFYLMPMKSPNLWNLSKYLCKIYKLVPMRTTECTFYLYSHFPRAF